MTSADGAWDRAAAVASDLKPGTWESVETLALLALAARDRPKDAALWCRAAEECAARLKPGGWASVRALALLSMATRATPG
ncbi:MAG: hypothetical protein IPM90_09335 [Austwickia sp.]|nr:hypothetical protein [Austwickia sp.]